MKWHPKTLEYGQTRTVKRFAFWPTRVYKNADPDDNSKVMVWLEIYAVEQEVGPGWTFWTFKQKPEWISNIRYALWPEGTR